MGLCFVVTWSCIDDANVVTFSLSKLIYSRRAWESVPMAIEWLAEMKANGRAVPSEKGLMKMLGETEVVVVFKKITGDQELRTMKCTRCQSWSSSSQSFAAAAAPHTPKPRSMS